MERPPSPIWWELDGLTFGHTPAETISYLAHCADFADEQAGLLRERSQPRALPPGVVSPEADTWLSRLLRR